MENIFPEITRRQLIQTAAASAFLLGMPDIAGCSSIPKYQPVGAAKNKTLYLIHSNVFDIVQGIFRRDQTIAVRNGVIETISSQVPSALESDMILDLKNQFVIPGLIDAHCHATLSGESTLNPLRILTTMNQMKRNYIQQIKQGVTTIRDMGAMPKVLHDYIAQIEKSELIGPRVVYCNSFTNIYGSHPDINPADVSIFIPLLMTFTGNPNLWFKDTADLKEKMRQNSTFGASFIKLTMDKKSVLCGKGEIPVYADEHLKVIFDYAQENNLATAGHIHSKFGFDRALQYGIGSMEHSIADAVLTEKEVTAMAKKKIAIVPTMIIAQILAAQEAYDKLPPKYRNDFIDREMTVRREYINSSLNDYTEASIHQNNIAYLENYRKFGCGNLYQSGRYMANPEIYFDILLVGPRNLKAMKDAGIVIGCGTDAGVPLSYHGTLWREMEMLGRIGFSNREILQCVTINNAKIVGMADKIGSVEAGKYADLVILKENPLEKIEACRKPHIVIKNGEIYDVGKIIFNA
jgi:imidazolonepropionase-like amidohydrolase